MYSKELAENFEQKREFEQNRFIKGNHNYWMLKTEKEVTIYDNDIKIFKYDEQHTEFLKAIPLFTDTLAKLETKLKKLYEYAYSTTYDSAIFKNHIIDISDCLQKNMYFSF